MSTTMRTRQVRTLDSEQARHVQAWIALALQKMPYMASMLFSLRFLDAPGLGTFGVDDRHRCYIDFDAVISLGPEYCAQALLHECSHLFAEHATFARDLGIDVLTFKAWAVAADAAINDDLRDGGLDIFDEGNEYGHILPSTLGEKDYQTPHHYFHVIVNRLAQQFQQARQNAQVVESGPDGGHRADSSASPGQEQEPGQHGGQVGASEPSDRDNGTGAAPRAGAGSVHAAPSEQPAQHEPWDGGCGSGAGTEPSPWELDDTDDLDGGAPPATSTEQQRVRIATATAITDHATGRGTTPAGLVQQAEFVLAPPQVPWQRILGRTLRGVVQARAGSTHLSYQRRNRRRHDARLIRQDGSPGRRMVLPALVDQVPRIHVIRDTSGSMTHDDLNLVTNEVVGIAGKLRVRGQDLVITDVDAEAYDTKKYTGHQMLAEVTGRGGTDMRAGIQHALATRPRPTAVVVMTDGQTPWPAKQVSRIPVIAVIIRPAAATTSTNAVPNWIRTVVIDTAATP